MAHDQSLVVWAIAGGRETARGVNKLLTYLFQVKYCGELFHRFETVGPVFYFQIMPNFGIKLNWARFSCHGCYSH